MAERLTVSLPEAAKMIPMAHSTAKRLAATGWLIPGAVRVYRVGRCYRVPFSDLASLAEAAGHRPAPADEGVAARP